MRDESAPVEPPSLNWSSVSEPAGDVVAVIFVNPAPSPLKCDADTQPLALMEPYTVIPLTTAGNAHTPKPPSFVSK